MKYRVALLGFIALWILAGCHAKETAGAKTVDPPTAAGAARAETAAVAASPRAGADLPAPIGNPSVENVLADAVVPINDRHYAPALMRLIDSAQVSLRVCLYQARFYTEYPASLSNQLVDKLILARERGVDVQVIIDTSPWKEGGEFDKQNQETAIRLVKGGCRVFLDSTEIQSHQKTLIADAQVTVVASANWSHYSLTSNREVAVMIWSVPVADAYTSYFADRLMEATPFTPPTTKEALILEAKWDREVGLLQPEDLAKSEGGLPVATDARITTLNNRAYYTRLAPALRDAGKSVSVVQDYAYYYATTPKSDRAPASPARAVPSETNRLFDDLVAAHKRGTEVRTVFDLTIFEDTGANFGGEDFANRLWALGIKAYYDDPTVRIHAKMLVIDAERAVIGSTNWSHQALEENNECSVLIDSKTLGAFYADWTDSIFAKAHPVVKPIEKNPPKDILPAPGKIPPPKTED